MSRLEERLQALHTATVIDDMDLPGWRLHSFKGKMSGLWAVNVSGNWRIVFEFKDGHAYVVNYEDYNTKGQALCACTGFTNDTALAADQ